MIGYGCKQMIISCIIFYDFLYTLYHTFITHNIQHTHSNTLNAYSRKHTLPFISHPLSERHEKKRKHRLPLFCVGLHQSTYMGTASGQGAISSQPDGVPNVLAVGKWINTGYSPNRHAFSIHSYWLGKLLGQEQFRIKCQNTCYLICF